MTQERLKETLHYDEITGKFTRILGRKKVGTWNKGYLTISINYKRYKAHRLAWLYTYGKFPEGVIDHINHITTDNRILNLRDVTASGNSQSMKLYKCNTSGYHGVIWDDKNKNWRARIGVEGRTLNLGSFTCKDEAVAARQAAEVKYNFHSNHGVNNPDTDIGLKDIL